MSIDKYSSIFDLYTDPQRKVWRRQWLPIPAFSPGEIPGTEEPGGLQSMGSHRIRHDWAQRKFRNVLYFTEDIYEIQKGSVHCTSCQRQTNLTSDRTRIPVQLFTEFLTFNTCHYPGPLRALWIFVFSTHISGSPLSQVFVIISVINLSSISLVT